MKKAHIFAGMSIALLIMEIGAPLAFAQNASGNRYPVLGPCTRDDKVYQFVDFIQKPFEEWQDVYHKTVNDIIEEHLEPAKLQCSASTYQGLLEPGAKLTGLAHTLPPWSKPTDFAKLKQSDFGLVLLEYLRVYECSLSEYSFFQAPEIIREEFRTQGATNAILDIFQADIAKKILKRSAIVESELKTARPTLYKTLDLLSSYDRLRPMEAELECLQRTSLDIRNVMSLSAETSACLPRIWSAKDPLRDLPE